MTNRIWQNFLASNIHRGINNVAAQKSSSNIKGSLCLIDKVRISDGDKYRDAIASKNGHHMMIPSFLKQTREATYF